VLEDDGWEVVPAKKLVSKSSDQDASPTSSDAVVSSPQEGSPQVEANIAVGDAVGEIIGKKGATISKIQTDSKARINVDKDTKVVNITGSQESVDAATAAVKAVLAAREAGQSVRDAPRVYESEEAVVISSRNKGTIIGKAGSRIKQLRETHGVALEFKDGGNSGNTSDGGEERITLMISGAKDKVRAAKAAVHTVLYEEGGGYSEDVVIANQTVSRSAFVGKGGCNIKKIEQDYNVRVNVAKEVSTPLKVTITGSQKNVKAARPHVQEASFVNAAPVLADGEVIEPVDIETSSRGTLPAGGGGAGRVGTRFDAGKAIGAVIGHGGATIKCIEQSTGARLTRTKAIAGTPSSSLLDIAGTPEQIAAARDRVQQVVQAYDSTGGGAPSDRKLFVGKLSRGVDDRALRAMFESHGGIEECVVLKDAMSGNSN
jgi:polyribonucleotide nucleotidyltransferase